MTRLVASLLCLALAAPSLAQAAPASRAPLDSLRRAAVREGWPNTDAGLVAARWVHAFSKGEKAMRALLEEILTPESLAKRGWPERMESYRDMKVDELVKVVKSAPSALTVELAGSDLTPRTFTFEVEPQKPHRLVKIAYQDYTHGHGGGFSH